VAWDKFKVKQGYCLQEGKMSAVVEEAKAINEVKEVLDQIQDLTLD
jgi:hypothetical protein